MRILITGGSGFVGQALCPLLKAQGHRPMVASRTPERVREYLPKGTDIRRSALDFVDTPPHAIVNLAGEPIAARRWSAAQKERLIDSRINTTHELVTLCEQLSRTGTVPRVMVSGSAMGFYGDQGEREVDEDTPPHDEFAHRLCRRWEEAAQAVEEYGTRLAILRIGLVLDRHGGTLQRMLPPFRLGLGGRFGHGQQFMPWVHRQDLVRMIVFLLEHEGHEGAFNGSAPQPVTNAEFARQLAQHLKRPTLLPVPAWLLKAAFGEMSQLLLSGADMRPRRFEAAGFTFRFPTLDDALDDILGRE